MTNDSRGCEPIRRVASVGGSRILNEREATSVSRTTARSLGSGKLGVARLGDESEELIQFFVGLERVAAQFVHRSDRVRTGRPPDQILKRHQVRIGLALRMFGAYARPDHLRCIPSVSILMALTQPVCVYSPLMEITTGV